MHDSKELAEEVGRLGASGCLIKTHAARQLVRAMQAIFDGGTFFSSEDTPSAKPVTEKPEKKNGILRVGSALLGFA
jgi:DNA-binding NarL/FixJ family response regulator